MKNKLLVCFRPVAVQAEADSAEPEELSVNTTTTSTSTYRSSSLRKSNSFIIKSSTKLVDDESNKIKRKETNRSISGSFVVGLSLIAPKGEVVPTIDLRNASKRNRFSSEDKCWDGRLDDDCKQSLSEASLKLLSSGSFDQKELERGSIKKIPDKKGEGCGMSKQKKKKKKKNKIMGAGAESRSRSEWEVYLILLISLLTMIFYGRVCSVLVTSSSSSCLFLCLSRWKTSLSSRTKSGGFHEDERERKRQRQREQVIMETNY